MSLFQLRCLQIVNGMRRAILMMIGLVELDSDGSFGFTETINGALKLTTKKFLWLQTELVRSFAKKKKEKTITVLL